MDNNREEIRQFIKPLVDALLKDIPESADKIEADKCRNDRDSLIVSATQGLSLIGYDLKTLKEEVKDQVDLMNLVRMTIIFLKLVATSPQGDLILKKATPGNPCVRLSDVPTHLQPDYRKKRAEDNKTLPYTKGPIMPIGHN